MARQKGVITLEGKAGKLTFIHGKNGFTARTADGISGSRIRTDPAFARTRENGVEFGRAGKAAKLMRDAFSELVAGVADRNLTSRLVREMLKVVKSDTTNDRGQRTAGNGAVTSLAGFEFNISSLLKSVLIVETVTSIDKAAALGTVTVQPFNPSMSLVAPTGATHFSFNVGIAGLDFDLGTQTKRTLMGQPRELINEDLAAEQLTVTLPQPAGDLPLFLVFGVKFMQMVNGKTYSLKSSGNALKIVAVG